MDPNVRLGRRDPVAMHIAPDELQIFELSAGRSRTTLLRRRCLVVQDDADPLLPEFDGKVPSILEAYAV
jgi:hypothetical protein